MPRAAESCYYAVAVEQGRSVQRRIAQRSMTKNGVRRCLSRHNVAMMLRLIEGRAVRFIMLGLLNSCWGYTAATVASCCIVETARSDVSGTLDTSLHGVRGRFRGNQLSHSLNVRVLLTSANTQTTADHGGSRQENESGARYLNGIDGRKGLMGESACGECM